MFLSFMSSVLAAVQKEAAVLRNMADVSFGTFTSLTCKATKNGSFFSQEVERGQTCLY